MIFYVHLLARLEWSALTFATPLAVNQWFEYCRRRIIGGIIVHDTRCRSAIIGRTWPSRCGWNSKSVSVERRRRPPGKRSVGGAPISAICRDNARTCECKRIELASMSVSSALWNHVPRTPQSRCSGRNNYNTDMPIFWPTLIDRRTRHFSIVRATNLGNPRAVWPKFGKKSYLKLTEKSNLCQYLKIIFNYKL